MTRVVGAPTIAGMNVHRQGHRAMIRFDYRDGHFEVVALDMNQLRQMLHTGLSLTTSYTNEERNEAVAYFFRHYKLDEVQS